VSTWAAQVAARAERSSLARRSAVLTAAAWNLLDLGDPRRAHELAKAALRDGAPTEGVSPSFPQLALSVTAALLEGPARAVEILEAHKQELVSGGRGNAWTLATVDVVLGAWQMMGGDFAAARANAEEAAAVARELGNPSALAMALYLLAHTLSYDDPERGLALARESVALTRSGASDVVFAPASVLIARVLAERGDARDAMAELRDALQWCLHVVARAELADDVDYGVDILGLLGHFDTAAVFAGIL